MPPDDLPLLTLFTHLREAGLPLGIGEYQWVLQAWQAGYGTADRSALKRLCRTVWVKSPEEAQIFEVAFERLVKERPLGSMPEEPQPLRISRLWAPKTLALAGLGISTLVVVSCFLALQSRANTVESQLSPLFEQVGDSSILLYQASEQVLPAPAVAQDGIDDIQDQLQKVTLVTVPVSNQGWMGYSLALWISLWLGSGLAWGWLQWRSSRTPALAPEPAAGVSLAVTRQMQDEVQIARLSQTLPTGDYLPVTRRQMKQSWRYLRRMVRSGAATELDVEATVQDIGQRGLLLAPIFRPCRVNRAEVVLLVDWEGSMVPFHGLAQRLVDTALQGGRLTRASVYYFHNCPLDWVYSDPYQQTAKPLDQVLQAISSDYAGVLVVSDGGAACGRWHPQRLAQTQQFLARVSQRVRYRAWLNPMPQPRWEGTTAAAIAQQVPMFEFDRTGLEAAIGVLRGQRRSDP